MGLPTAERDTKYELAGCEYKEYTAAAGDYYYGTIVGIATDDGMLKNLSGTVVKPAGMVTNPGKTTIATHGGGTIKVFQGEVWLANSTTNTVSASHIGDIASMEITSNNHTVGMLRPGFHFAGQIKDVNSTYGVLVKVPASIVSGSTAKV